MMSAGRYFFAIVFLLGLFSLHACDFLPDPQRRKVTIVSRSSELGDSAFSPNPVIIPVGGRIVWRNDDVMEHAVVGDAKEGPCVFKSEPIGHGEKFSKSFFERVVCEYYCALHGRTMRGKIIVE